MADHHGIPHYHNEPGLPVVTIPAREFMCIGAPPPLDHPHIYLDMGSDTEIVCPYFSTLYRRSTGADAGEASPSTIWMPVD